MIDFASSPHFVKICGVTTPQDARVVVDAGADALGLIFAGSKRHVDDTLAVSIVRATPEIAHVGVFREVDDDAIITTVERVGIDVVQIHGPLTSWLATKLRERAIPIIKALGVHDAEFLSFDDRSVDAVLVDGADPGSGVAYTRSLVSRRSFRRPLIIAGGLHPGNVVSVIEEIAPWGVDVATGVEQGPRIKDATLVAKFVTLAHEAFERKALT